MVFTLLIRCVIIYAVVLVLIRVMGKRQMGQMQPFEFVITLIIADLATLPMSENSIPLIQGIIPLLALSVVHYLLCFFSRKSVIIKKFINGKPLILINQDGIEYDNLKIANMSFSDLIEGLRTLGYFNLDEILYAILQTNGSLTVIPRSIYKPLTPNDIQLKAEQATLPLIIFSEGKMISDNAKLAKIDIDFVKQELKKDKLELENVILIMLDQEGKVYIQPKNAPSISRESSYKGGNW